MPLVSIEIFDRCCSDWTCYTLFVSSALPIGRTRLRLVGNAEGEILKKAVGPVLLYGVVAAML